MLFRILSYLSLFEVNKVKEPHLDSQNDHHANFTIYFIDNVKNKTHNIWFASILYGCTINGLREKERMESKYSN